MFLYSYCAFNLAISNQHTSKIPQVSFCLPSCWVPYILHLSQSLVHPGIFFFFFLHS